MLLVLLLGTALLGSPASAATASAGIPVIARSPANDDVLRLRALLGNLKTPANLADALELAEKVFPSTYADLLVPALAKKICDMTGAIVADSAALARFDGYARRIRKGNALADFVFLESLPRSSYGLRRPSAIYYLKFRGKLSISIREVSVTDGWRVVARTPLAPVRTYGKNLAESLEFIDFFDLAYASVTGRGEPWAKYDEWGKPGLLPRWRDAKDFAVSQKDVAKTPRENVEFLKTLQSRIAGDSQGIRGHPIVAGGDVFVHDKGYYPVSPEEKAVLEANPYLVVETIENPYPGVHAKYLARHEYPSVRHYRRWNDRLPSALVETLGAAEARGILNDFSLDETRDLNKRLIEALLEESLARSAKLHFDAATTYQELISIHPFSDYNGRSLRLFYQIRQDPLFLVDFNNDLFLNRNDFILEVEKGEWRRRDLIESLAEMEKRNPDFPKYYDAPEIYRVLSDLDEPDLAKFADKKGEFEKIFQSDRMKSLVREKRFAEAGEELRSRCIRLFRGE